MQRSIMSFFHPKKEGKAKKPEKETSSREIEPPPKVALKERNGEVPENDSPVKRPGRKAARVLGSEGEEEDEALTPSKGQKPAPGSPQVSPPSPVTFPEGSPPLSNTSPAGLSPTGIPKRRTAETPTESLTEPELVAGKQEAREGDQAKPPPRAPKTVSSFFAPRKPATKKEGKEEGPGTPRKEEAKGPLDPPGYNPAKNNYHPVDDACWKPGQKVPYLAVARTFEKIEEVSARLRMVETLSNLLRSVVALSPPDLLPILYLSLNRLGPPQQGLELGVGDGVLLKAVAQATGKQGVWWPLERRGLRGRRGRDTHWPAWPQSTAKKIDVIKGLFVACRHSEARFIARALSGRLRLGLAEQSVLAALAQAVSLTPPRPGEAPRLSPPGVPDLDRIIPVLLEHGLEHLPEHCRLSPGVPLKPMLAHPTRGVSEILKRFEEAAFTCEYKYDGQRAQVGGWTRSLGRRENTEHKEKQINLRLPLKTSIKLPSVTSFILDTEAVAWDREKKQIQPFQVLTTRKRKEVDAADIQVQVCLYAFDLIYLNGESLVREPLSRRRQLLRENFVQTEGEFVFATSLDTKDTDQIAEFLEQSVKDSCEGLMVKTLDIDATYEIAKRSHNWLKLKKDYLDGVGDTLDLVVIGAYLGRGKRAGRYGGFLLAAYDEESEELQAICKVPGGGCRSSSHHGHALVLPTPRSYVRADGAVAPDHWLDPSAVWEVKCADLSLSPIYPAARGLVDSEKGISLRFPRFIRVREDKKPEEATTSAQVRPASRRWVLEWGGRGKQSQIQNQQGADLDSDPEDFY
uniref:DNA ligase n=1 Tax=Panthera tigris altaica TaxID=74533 RepID=A0A8C9JG34_PANTA